MTATVIPLPARGRCSQPGCARSARLAIDNSAPALSADARTGVQRKDLGPVAGVIYYDYRVAPARARLLCKAHGLPLVVAMLSMMVAADEDPEPDPDGEPEDSSAVLFRNATRP
jgi:hypothetical protein